LSCNGECFSGIQTIGACFSENRTHRFSLSRIWDESKPNVGFLLLNPSIADEYKLDPTLKRCKSFAEQYGFGGMCITNTFSLVSTNPEGLLNFNIESDESLINKNHIKSLCEKMPIILGFGTNIKKYHYDKVISMFKEILQGKEIYTLKITKDGLPSHPLYLPGNSTLINYDLNLLTN